MVLALSAGWVGRTDRQAKQMGQTTLHTIACVRFMQAIRHAAKLGDLACTFYIHPNPTSHISPQQMD